MMCKFTHKNSVLNFYFTEVVVICQNKDELRHLVENICSMIIDGVYLFHSVPLPPPTPKLHVQDTTFTAELYQTDDRFGAIRYMCIALCVQELMSIAKQRDCS